MSRGALPDAVMAVRVAQVLNTTVEALCLPMEQQPSYLPAVSDRIRYLAQSRGWSDDQVAVMADLEPEVVKRWLSYRDPEGTLLEATQLSRALGTTTDYLGLMTSDQDKVQIGRLLNLIRGLSLRDLENLEQIVVALALTRDRRYVEKRP
jgi:hypothetical protein